MVQKDSLKSFAVVVCGPTGSGKTKLAIDIAKEFNGEIISADSIAIYRGLDIGTAKPDEYERAAAKHHMIDVVDADKEFSVAEYKDQARAILKDILSRGKLPIICGGTGYYIDALLYDFSYGNCPKNDEFRAYCDDVIDRFGIEALYDKLKSVDPETASVLHLNDKMRIVRALEIFETTGVKKSEILDEKTPIVPFSAFSYDYERAKLYSRIDKRVDVMFSKGLVLEVENLLKTVPPSTQSMQGIGYKEIVEGLTLGCSIDEMKETVKRNTRRYAKRQITWFKRLDNLTYLSEGSSLCDVKDKIYEGLRD